MSEQPRNNGGRNLTIFGVAVIILAIFSSGLSLFIYSATGDIYLDRSRPGFISDDEDISDEDFNALDNTFSPDGDITAETLDEYLDKFDSAVRDADVHIDAFSPDALSDEVLNLTGSTAD